MSELDRMDVYWDLMAKLRQQQPNLSPEQYEQKKLEIYVLCFRNPKQRFEGLAR